MQKRIKRKLRNSEHWSETIQTEHASLWNELNLYTSTFNDNSTLFFNNKRWLVDSQLFNEFQVRVSLDLMISKYLLTKYLSRISGSREVNGSVQRDKGQSDGTLSSNPHADWRILQQRKFTFGIDILNVEICG